MSLLCCLTPWFSRRRSECDGPAPLTADSKPIPGLSIVVARYREDLTDWIPYAANVHVYAKYPTPESEDSFSRDIFQSYTELENKGREGQTYLEYIVKNYDHLDSITLFTQAAPFDKLAPVTKDVNDMITKTLKVPVGEVTVFNPALLRTLSEWEKIDWSSNSENYWITSSQIKTMAPATFTMGDFFKIVTGQEHPNAIRALHGACFAVRRETILSNPKSWYERALGEFQRDGGHVNPEVGFFMERMWLPLMDKRAWLHESTSGI